MIILKLLFNESNYQPIFNNLNNYTILDTYSDNNKVYYTLELTDTPELELELDSLVSNYKEFRYIFIKDKYRVHINKKGHKIITNNFKKMIIL